MINAFLFDYDGVITAGVKDNVPATRLAASKLGIRTIHVTDHTEAIKAVHQLIAK